MNDTRYRVPYLLASGHLGHIVSNYELSQAKDFL